MRRRGGCGSCTPPALSGETYFRADTHEAVLVLECADADEAKAVLAEMPLVSAGLITFEVIPLAPYDGFARLFRPPDESE